MAGIKGCYMADLYLSTVFHSTTRCMPFIILFLLAPLSLSVQSLYTRAVYVYARLGWLHGRKEAKSCAVGTDCRSSWWQQPPALLAHATPLCLTRPAPAPPRPAATGCRQRRYEEWRRRAAPARLQPARSQRFLSNACSPQNKSLELSASSPWRTSPCWRRTAPSRGHVARVVPVHQRRKLGGGLVAWRSKRERMERGFGGKELRWASNQ